MIAKKISVLALCCLALFSSCEKDSDLQDKVDQLEKELAAEKSKTVVDIKKEGNDLVVIYSNGTTQKVSYTDAIKGNIGGQNGQDGVGIKSITYNEQTGVLTITLTNGEVSEFKISGSGADWSAVLIGDTNGRLFIEEALVGAVPVVTAAYNIDFQLTTLESHQVAGAEARKNFGLVKSYRNGALDNYSINKYALRDQVSYTSNWVYYNYITQVSFAENKGDRFSVDNGDGTSSVYVFYYQSGSQYYYTKYAKCIVVASDNAEYKKYEIVRKKSETEFYYYGEITSSSTQKYFALSDIVTITGRVTKGDVLSSAFVDVETDGSGRITRAYEGIEQGGQATKYISYEYNSAGLLKTSKIYGKDAQGAWVTGGDYETYNYDTNNRLTSTTRTYADGRTQEVQKAVYDTKGNPTEIWTWQPAVYEYSWNINPTTGERGYQLVRAAGLQKVAMLEYDYTFKNFLGNTISALVPELEGYKAVNALKRVTVPNSYSFANIEYKDFNEHGYPRRMKMDASYLDDVSNDGEAYAANVEVLLNYKVKAK